MSGERSASAPVPGQKLKGSYCFAWKLKGSYCFAWKLAAYSGGSKRTLPWSRYEPNTPPPAGGRGRGRGMVMLLRNKLIIDNYSDTNRTPHPPPGGGDGGGGEINIKLLI